ncbi:hypothetical protein [Solilutibacter tolerans]|uniref:hypothetical protein n=1 Tax=Solilutibacter tolerans TaxID=1604334 RepID=UPI00101ADD88|nr:hypothetical protein [Lysobacter tolerans]
MNWSSVVKLALVLFIAQVIAGFLDGLLIPPGGSLSWYFAGHAASLVVCSAIFAFFAVRNSARAFAHAWLGLLLQALIGLAFSLTLSILLGDLSWTSIALEWVVLILALAIGTSIGISVRNTSRPADA